MIYYTYILYSPGLKKYYTGQTEDLERRIKEHNDGKTPFMKSGKPWELVCYFTFLTRSESMALEHKIKKRGAERFLRDHGYIC